MMDNYFIWILSIISNNLLYTLSIQNNVIVLFYHLKQARESKFSVQYFLERGELNKLRNYESEESPNNFTVPASRSLICLSLSSHANAKRCLFGCHATVKVGDSQGTSAIFSPSNIKWKKINIVNK